MINLGNLRDMAANVRRQYDDHEVAAALDAIADARAEAIREKLGGPGWLSAADVPEGTVFCAASRPDALQWRREGGMCRALPPYGTDRLYSPAIIDAANSWDNAGYVEAKS